jgi:hypothetical protein
MNAIIFSIALLVNFIHPVNHGQQRAQPQAIEAVHVEPVTCNDPATAGASAPVLADYLDGDGTPYETAYADWLEDLVVRGIQYLQVDPTYPGRDVDTRRKRCIMMSYQSIQSLKDEAAEIAEVEGKTPQFVRDVLTAYRATGRFPFPSLGDYVPVGWERAEQIEPLLVDKTGRGSEYELALTIKQFVKRLENFEKSGDPFAVAIIEEGEMQLVVGVFVPARGDFTHSGKLTDYERKQVVGKYATNKR